jgi:enoyl-CoA hydratase/carnithine racemase
MVLLGEKVDATTALRIGLADEVVDSGQALTRALAMAEAVSRQSPGAVRACKRLLQAARCVPPSQALIQERQEFLDLFDTADQREGATAFLEKRPARWING